MTVHNFHLFQATFLSVIGVLDNILFLLFAFSLKFSIKNMYRLNGFCLKCPLQVKIPYLSEV